MKRVMFLLAGVVALATAGAAEGWKYRWPLLTPAVNRSRKDCAVRVPLDAALKVTVSCENGDRGAAWVKGKLKEWLMCEASCEEVTFTGEPVSTNCNREAYELLARPGELAFRAQSLSGVKLAMMTLRQLAQPVRGTLKLEGYEVPEFDIHDEPQLAFRGMHLCAFHGMSIARLERMIRLAAYFKFNYVVVEQWGGFRSEKYPWYGWKDGTLTIAECRRLTALARDLGVTLIPQLNVFGHASAARSNGLKHATLDRDPAYQPLFEPRAGWNWCISNPRAREVVKGLIAELHEAFERPPFFHIGCDEAHSPTCAACCGGNYRQLLAEYMLEISTFVETLGARPMMWHDMLLSGRDPRWRGFFAHGSDDTAALTETLPKSTVICDWYYYGKKDAYPTLDYFKSCGFDTLTCPWEDKRGILAQGNYARAKGFFGMMGTVWHHYASSLCDIFTRTSGAAWSDVSANAENAGDQDFATYWRQVGWDTPGCDLYEESGIYCDETTSSVLSR